MQSGLDGDSGTGTGTASGRASMSKVSLHRFHPLSLTQCCNKNLLKVFYNTDYIKIKSI